jgi:hypothetical protein
MVSASHSSAKYNGFKFCRENAMSDLLGLPPLHTGASFAA